MQQAFIEGDKFQSFEISDIQIEHLGDDDNTINTLGVLLRCRLTVASNDPKFPESVVVKLSSPNPVAKKIEKLISIYQREYHFYAQVAQHAHLRSPSLYFGAYDADQHQFVLVLEDLEGMELVPQITGIDPRRAQLAVCEIAKLHAQFWKAIHSPPVAESLDTLSKSYGRLMQIAYLYCLPRVFERFEDYFSLNTVKCFEKLGIGLVEFYKEIATHPRTYIHGDFRAENLFFGVGNSNKFVAIDWQGSGSGSCLYDLAYFLSMSVTSDVRRKYEHELLQHYHETLCELGVKDFTFKECWRNYRQNTLNAFIPCVLGVGGFDISDQRANNLAHVLLERVLTAIDDLHALDFLPSRNKLFATEFVVSQLMASGYKTYKLFNRFKNKNIH